MYGRILQKLQRAIAVVSLVSLASCGGGGAGSSLTGNGSNSGGSSSTTPGASTQTYKISLAASGLTIGAGGTSTLTATVTDGTTGAAVQGIPVTFVFGSNLSGGSLAATPTTTDTSGKTSLIYTAGATAGVDTVLVQAQDSAGVVATGSVNITVTNQSNLNLAVSASQISVKAGQPSTITAIVTNGSNQPVANQVVNFALGSNLSGASLSSPTAKTDGSGTAQVSYTAGSITGTDRIIASATAINAQQVAGYTSITVTSANKSALYTASWASSTTTTTTGGIINFTLHLVTNDASGNPTTTAAPQGTEVDFKFGSAQSGTPQLNTTGAAPSLTTAIGYTDASGNVYISYQAGNKTGTDALVATITDPNGVSSAATTTITVN